MRNVATFLRSIGPGLSVLLSMGLAAGSDATVVRQAHVAGDVEIEARTTRLSDGEVLRYEIGTLYVPENRDVAGSRLIGVGFVRLRAARPTGAPPVFVLPGGPGRSYLAAFTDGDADQLRMLDAYVLPHRAVGDVVVVDQRGYSRRGDVLEFAGSRQRLDRARSSAVDAADMIALADRAVAAHRDIDLAGYTIVQCAHDVEDLRRALGYRQVTLAGQSFGSQWAFAVMRLHPGSVARALLSGVEPLDATFDMPSQVIAALQRIAWGADHDPALAAYLPQGGVMAALRAVHARFDNGRTIDVDLIEDATNRQQRVTLGHEDLQAAMLKPAAAWPAFVLSLYHQHYEAWARETIERRNASGDPVRLIEPLIDSSLGVSAARGHLLRTDPGAGILGIGDFDALLASAPHWPTPDVGDALRLPMRSDIPVLFFHGDWDTSTPVENTLGALPYFPNSRAVLVHRAGHHSRAPAFARHPGLLEQVNAFLDSGDLQDIPVDVVLPTPAFQRPAFPPPRSGP